MLMEGGVLVLTLGLCGGSGTGKTTAQAAFCEAGIAGLDTDLLYHKLISGDTPLSRTLITTFGEGIRAAEGGIDRRALAGLVFGSPEADARRLTLNRITHAEVLRECRAFLDAERKAGAFAAVINAPLLFESGFAEECDITVAILAPRDVRIARIVARDGITPEEAARRIDSQLSDDFLTKRTTYQIHNDGSEAELRQAVAALINKIKNRTEE